MIVPGCLERTEVRFRYAPQVPGKDIRPTHRERVPPTAGLQEREQPIIQGDSKGIAAPPVGSSQWRLPEAGEFIPFLLHLPETRHRIRAAAGVHLEVDEPVLLGVFEEVGEGTVAVVGLVE
jgi:hypothetical protein